MCHQEIVYIFTRQLCSPRDSEPFRMQCDSDENCVHVRSTWVSYPYKRLHFYSACERHFIQGYGCLLKWPVVLRQTYVKTLRETTPPSSNDPKFWVAINFQAREKLTMQSLLVVATKTGRALRTGVIVILPLSNFLDTQEQLDSADIVRGSTLIDMPSLHSMQSASLLASGASSYTVCRSW